MPSTTPGERPTLQTTKATAAAQNWHAERALDNPNKVAHATRIVRAGLAKHRIELADVAPAETLAAHVRRVVDALPPLTEAQRAKLAAILGPGQSEAGAA